MNVILNKTALTMFLVWILAIFASEMSGVGAMIRDGLPTPLLAVAAYGGPAIGLFAQALDSEVRYTKVGFPIPIVVLQTILAVFFVVLTLAVGRDELSEFNRTLVTYGQLGAVIAMGLGMVLSTLYYVAYKRHDSIESAQIES